MSYHHLFAMFTIKLFPSIERLREPRDSAGEAQSG